MYVMCHFSLTALFISEFQQFEMKYDVVLFVFILFRILELIGFVN